MKTRKLTALLLCLLLIASCLLVACDQGGDDTSSGSTGTTSSTDSGNNSGIDAKYLDANGRYWPSYSDSMSESLIGDRTEIRVLVTSNEVETTYYSEEIEPDMYPTTDATLNEAVRERNNLVSEKLGIEIKAVPVANVQETFRQEALAPTGMFDIAMPTFASCAVLAQEGMFYDLRDFEDKGIIDLSAPWYDQNANESLSIQNRIYFTVSDMSIMHKINCFAMTYNPDLLSTKYPDLDLLQLVVDGEWTLDKLYEIGRSFSGDADGDGQQNHTDNWGLVSGYNDVIHFYMASGERLCTKDENDNPILAIGSDSSITVSQKILSMLEENNWVSFAQDLSNEGVTDIWNTSLAIFGEERAPFRVSVFSAIKKLRAYELDYGVIPMPKASADQDQYYTHASGGYGVVVPTHLNESDANFAAYMIDVLSAGGKQYIATAYYDQILKNKDALSDTSKEVDILDLIFENIVYDVGYIYDMGGLRTLHADLIADKSTDIVSALEAIRGQVTEKISQIVEQYAK